MDNIDLLKNTMIFNGLSDVELRLLLEGFIEHAFPIGTIIIQENDIPKKTLYIVKSGEIVVSTGPVDANEPGMCNDSMLTTLGAGDVIGEVSLIDDFPHSATVRTISDTVLLTLPATYFFSIVEKDKNIGFIVIRNIAKLLCQRLRDTNLAIHFGLCAPHEHKD